jgi:hypothetical protein
MSTPQDPADPQNPYGTPGPDSTPPPPPPNPYGTGPTEPPAAPAPAPDYASAPPPPPPAYGQPQPAYGQPQQPAYGQQPYPQYGAPQQQQPGKGMAIAALIISFFGCVFIGALVAIPLAIVVLVRSRGGQNHGKGLAISAIVISLVTLALPIILLVAGVSYVNSLTDVNDLKQGDCITADGLSDENAKSVTDIKTVSCSDDHDGEVLAVVDLTADQAQNYTTTPISEICGPAIDAAGKTDLITESVIYTSLTVSDPEAGDQAACVAYNADGSQLTSKLGS